MFKKLTPTSMAMAILKEILLYWILTTTMFSVVTLWAVSTFGVECANYALALLVSVTSIFTIIRAVSGVFGFLETLPIYLSMILVIPLVIVGRSDVAEMLGGLMLGGFLVSVIVGSFIGGAIESVMDTVNALFWGRVTYFDRDGFEEQHYHVCLKNQPR